jgi:flagellar basal-body rod protein FlgC
MDYNEIFRISAAGMAVEKARVDVAAQNIANMHTTRTSAGGPYSPMRVVTRTVSVGKQSFAQQMDAQGQAVGSMQMRAPEVVGLVATGAAPRMQYDPGHPDADATGMVAYPAVNQVNEMLTLVTAMRAYEANVTVLNAAKVMTVKALEIGGSN